MLHINTDNQSRIAIFIARRFSIAPCKPRTPASLGLFGTYDGNIIGAALLGVGMALTGACPGTVLPQLATGVSTGSYVLAGGILGGILYSKFGKLIRRNSSEAEKERLKNSSAITEPTLYQRAGADEGTGLLAYEAALLLTIGLVAHFFPEKEVVFLPAAIGGLYIGLSQALSLMITTFTLGVSTAYEQIGDVFWWAVSQFISKSNSPLPNYKGIAFPLGSVFGAWIFSKVFTIPAPVAVETISRARAVFGGVLLVFGARIAGGCTSGHGISGMSMLSIASIISVMAMFGSGILTATLLG